MKLCKFINLILANKIKIDDIRYINFKNIEKVLGIYKTFYDICLTC
jgi:hypothetical protein